MELQNPMMYHQSRLPLFSSAQPNLERNQTNPLHPALKSDIMELHNPMMSHQSRVPLFSHVARAAQRGLKRTANDPVHLDLKSEKNPNVDEEYKGTLQVAYNNNTEQPLKKQKLHLKELKPSSDVCLMNSSVTVKPGAILPDIISHLSSHVTKCPIMQTSREGLLNKQKLLKTTNMAVWQLDKDINALLKRIRTQFENEILHKTSTSNRSSC